MDRNWIDFGVLIVIGVFFLIGLSSGLVFSVFRIVSMFISMFVSLSLYEKLASFIYGTYAETVINAFIYDGFLSDPQVSAAQRQLDVDGALDGIIRLLKLPNGVAESIFTKPVSLGVVRRTNLFNDVDLIGYFSGQCTRAVIALFSVIAVYVAIRVLISIVKIFLDEIAALKIFRIFNFIGGPVLGIVEGIAAAYVALAVVMLVNIVIQLPQIYDILDRSNFARGLYDNNLFLNFMLGRMKL